MSVNQLEDAVATLSLKPTTARDASSPDATSLQPSPSPPSSSASAASSNNSQSKYVPPWKRQQQQQQQQQTHSPVSHDQRPKPRQSDRTPAKSDSSASNLSNLSPYLVFAESSSSKSVNSQSSASPSSFANSSPPASAKDVPASASRIPPSQNSSAKKSETATTGASATSTSGKGLVLDRDRQAAIDAEYIAKGLDIGFQPLNSGSGSSSSVSLSQILEAYDVPSNISSDALLESLGSGAVSIHSITDDSYVIIFERPTQADRACTMFNRSAKQDFKLVNSERASRAALRVAESIPAPSVSRPKTDNRVANRLLAGALGLRLPRRSEEERAAERARREERQKKLAEDKSAQAASSSQPNELDS